jgi:CheY-like chemotaxis protein
MSNRKKVLLIDDDHALIHMYALKFRLEGTFELLTAYTPEKGVALAQEIKPDLILLDLVLPKSDHSFGHLNKEIGFQVLEDLKKEKKTKNIPVVILTNLDEKTQGNVERARKLGAVDYWVKAYFQPGEVIEKLKVILR